MPSIHRPRPLLGIALVIGAGSAAATAPQRAASNMAISDSRLDVATSGTLALARSNEP